MMVAMLLAALLSPTVMLLRKKGVRAGGAAAIAEIGMILVLAGIISLTGQQILRGFVSMADKAMQGYQQLIGWLKDLGYEFGADQLNQLLEQMESAATNNPSSVLNGVSRVGSTAADVATGVLLTLFTLLFFLMEGERIWLFVVGLFPKDAREAVNGAGRAGWKSLGAYVRVQILVAAIDAIGIGLGAAILECAPGDSAGRAGVPGFLYPGDWCAVLRCGGGASGAGCSGPGAGADYAGHRATGAAGGVAYPAAAHHG